MTEFEGFKREYAGTRFQERGVQWEAMTELEAYKWMHAVLIGALSDGLDLLEEGRLHQLRALNEDALEYAEEIYCAWSEKSKEGREKSAAPEA